VQVNYYNFQYNLQGAYKALERNVFSKAKQTEENGRKHVYFYTFLKKAKAVPLHASEAFGGRGGIAPTHS
jgi:hypothetical protein